MAHYIQNANYIYCNIIEHIVNHILSKVSNINNINLYAYET